MSCAGRGWSCDCCEDCGEVALVGGLLLLLRSGVVGGSFGICLGFAMPNMGAELPHYVTMIPSFF